VFGFSGMLFQATCGCNADYFYAGRLCQWSQFGDQVLEDIEA
jgi:hypothetical protein